jgi:hypothetical protein
VKELRSKYVIEGDIEGKRRRGRRRKQLLYDLMKEGKYMNLKEEALDCTLWRICFGICYGPVELKDRLCNGLLLLLLSSSSLSSSIFPLYRVSTLIFLRQTMSLGNTVLQLF